MSSLVTDLIIGQQEIVNWVTTADGAFTLPTRLNSTDESRRRRRCVLDLTADEAEMAECRSLKRC